MNRLIDKFYFEKAKELVKLYQLVSTEFPKLNLKFQQDLVNKVFKKAEDWEKIEERMSYSSVPLTYLVENLYGELKMVDEAYSLVQRHKLMTDCPVFKESAICQELLAKPGQYKKNRILEIDGFAPTQEVCLDYTKGTFLHLNDVGVAETDVIFVDDLESQVFKDSVHDLMNAKLVGFDSEFMPSQDLMIDPGVAII